MYLGIVQHPKTKKWLVWSYITYLGQYDDPKEAAEKYDPYTLLKYKDKEPINNLVKLEDIKDIDIKTLICEREDNDLPPNIYLPTKKSSFDVQLKHKSKMFKRSTQKTVVIAVDELEKYKKELEEFKEKEAKDKQITRNENGIAIIPIKNKDKEIIDYSTVSDDKWHEVMKHSWTKSTDGYCVGYINKKTIKLHRFIMNASDDILVNHIDDNKMNNVTENLRFITSSINTHTNSSKRADASSKYYGVRFDKRSNKWISEIIKDKEHHHIGTFDEEFIAAKAYNIKAKELYGEFAKLNIFD